MSRSSLRYIKLLVYFFVVMMFASCASLPAGQWVKTSDGVSLWSSSLDTLSNYSWSGNSFDSIANGKGTVTKFGSDGSSNSYTSNMFYGASTSEDIVQLDDGSKFVGNTIDNKMEGYGVLCKGQDKYIGYFHEGKPNGFLRWYKGDVLYYDGFWKEGAFNGEGTLYKADGSIRSGEWSNGKLSQTYVDAKLPQGHYRGYARNGKPDGIGEIDYTNGSYYKGSWKNGSWNGDGIFISGNDSIYGIWNKGKICGDVVYRTPKIYYEGTLIDNSPVGNGNLVLNDGSYYSGFWMDGKRQGYGEMVFANGDTYFGEWANNHFHGQGTYRYSGSNATYEGQWSNGLQNGTGSYSCPEFSYSGQWNKGWMDGNGQLAFPNGDSYDGTLHGNVIDGIGIYTFSNGNRYDGEFVHGKMSGLGVFQFKNGDRFEGEFLDGKIYGDGTLYLVGKTGTVAITGFWPRNGGYPTSASILFPNGDLYEGQLKDGIPTEKGCWYSGKERNKKLQSVNNSVAHRANKFYKKHRETINWCLAGMSLVVTAIPVLQPLNVLINAADMAMAVGSAAIDVKEAKDLGEDASEAETQLGKELALNAAFIMVPKVCKVALKSGLKNVTRSAAARLALSGIGKNIIKKSALRLLTGKISGRVVRLKVRVRKGVRCVEKILVRGKYTQKPMQALGMLLTRSKHQFVTYSTYLNKIKNNPELKNKLLLSKEGNSGNLGNNMRLLDMNEWVKKNERIRRYLNLPKRQVEPHHIIPSNPTTELGRKARNVWTKYFGSVDHPCNGIWLGRSSSKYGYKSLAKGVNHVPNTKEYEQKVAAALLNTYKKYSKQYAKNPEMMRQKLAETVDELKRRLYNGDKSLAIGRSGEVHNVWNVFRAKPATNIVGSAAYNILNVKISK